MAGAHRRSPFEFTSSSFDPRQALQSESVSLPYPEARVYNNLAEYSSHTFGRRGGRPGPGGGSRDRYERDRTRYRSPSPGRYRSSSPRRYRSPSPSRRYRSPSPGIPRAYRSPSPRRTSSSSRYRSPSPGPSYSRRRSPQGRRRSPPGRDKYGGGKPPFRRGGGGGGRDFADKKRFLKTEPQDVLERMEKAFSKGPLEILYRCVQEKTRVKVWTRNYKEVRGICTGYVQAFDKHWNLAMADVDEVYLRPRKGKTPFLRELKPGEEELIPDMLPKVPKGSKAEDNKTEETGEKAAPTEASGDTPQKSTTGGEAEESWYSAVGDVTGGGDMDVSETSEGGAKTQPSAEGDDGYQSEQAFPGNGEQEKTSVPKEGEEMDVADGSKEADKNTPTIPYTKLPLTGEDIEELTKGKKKKKKKKRKGKGHEMCKRHVNKLFIRGDNVVMVALLKV